ncbi:hypothetical protein BRADI_5g13724v3, partial [Brachypodium distachyon]
MCHRASSDRHAPAVSSQQRSAKRYGLLAPPPSQNGALPHLFEHELHAKPPPRQIGHRQPRISHRYRRTRPRRPRARRNSHQSMQIRSLQPQSPAVEEEPALDPAAPSTDPAALHGAGAATCRSDAAGHQSAWRRTRNRGEKAPRREGPAAAVSAWALPGGRGGREGRWRARLRAIWVAAHIAPR